MAPKPILPMEISEQRCFECGKELRLGDEAIVHRINPVALCMKCGGGIVDKSPNLCRAKVVE